MGVLLPKKPYKARGSLGFTLIELLVVIAVISLLMGILLSALSMAMAHARRVRCASNLRTIAQAWILYLDDFDGRFYKGLNADDEGAHYNYGGWIGDTTWWPRPLNRFVGLKDPDSVNERTAKIFRCPSDRGGNPDSRYTEIYKLMGTSYQTNRFLIGPPNYSGCGNESQEFVQAAKEFVNNTVLNKVNVASQEVLLIGDGGWYTQWHPLRTSKKWQTLQKIGEWHRKKEHYNIAFLDGHVSFVWIRKGWYSDPGEYSILPNKKLRERVSPPLP